MHIKNLCTTNPVVTCYISQILTLRKESLFIERDLLYGPSRINNFTKSMTYIHARK
jgi:hypothetical protein